MARARSTGSCASSEWPIIQRLTLRAKGDLAHPRLVAQPLGERLCLAHEPHTPLDLAERVDGVAKVEADVDRLLDGLAGLGEMCRSR